MERLPSYIPPPGASGADPELMDRFAQALRTRGEGYRPRTRHLGPDGWAKYTNRLFLETSPYLLQHAHNPVDWYPVGRRGVRAGAAARPSRVREHRLLHLPLVPRHGGGIVRGRGDRPVPERAFRRHQGGPRGAPRRGRDLHEGRPGLLRDRRMAAERLADPGPEAVLRRDVLPAPGRPLRDGDRLPGDSPGAVGQLRFHGGGGGGDLRQGDGVHPPGVVAGGRGRPSHRRGADRCGALLPRPFRSRERRHWPRRRSSPANCPSVSCSAFTGARGTDLPRHGAANPRGDGRRGDLRPRGWRIPPVLHGRKVAYPPLREDALRQRAPRPAYLEGLPGDRQEGFRPGRTGDVALHRAGHDRAGRGVLLRNGRGQPGRRRPHGKRGLSSPGPRRRSRRRWVRNARGSSPDITA